MISVDVKSLKGYDEANKQLLVDLETERENNRIAKAQLDVAQKEAEDAKSLLQAFTDQQELNTKKTPVAKPKKSVKSESEPVSKEETLSFVKSLKPYQVCQNSSHKSALIINNVHYRSKPWAKRS